MLGTADPESHGLVEWLHLAFTQPKWRKLCYYRIERLAYQIKTQTLVGSNFSKLMLPWSEG
jgi:hypothetical protein